MNWRDAYDYAYRQVPKHETVDIPLEWAGVFWCALVLLLVLVSSS